MDPLQKFLSMTVTLWSRPRHFQISSEEPSLLLSLPTELLLIIITYLPDPSRASLALTCKTLLSFQSASLPFKVLSLPRDQPSTFRSPSMSKPSIYQPLRWEFLSLLERDLKGKWSQCSECFTLHPKRMFAAYEKSIPSWLAKFYKTHASHYRSCRHGRSHLCRLKFTPFYPSGIVDLCPCIKLTFSKKLRIEAELADNIQRQGRKSTNPAAEHAWWHQCRHTYGAVEIDLRIKLFLYDGISASTIGPQHHNFTDIPMMEPKPGSLGAILEYRHTYPTGPSFSTPRLLCPHTDLQPAIEDLFLCRKLHRYPETKCFRCRYQIEQCDYCQTELSDFRPTDDVSAGMTACSYRVVRCLDDHNWPMQTVFPFDRRQQPLSSRSAFLT